MGKVCVIISFLTGCGGAEQTAPQATRPSTKPAPSPVVDDDHLIQQEAKRLGLSESASREIVFLAAHQPMPPPTEDERRRAYEALTHDPAEEHVEIRALALHTSSGDDAHVKARSAALLSQLRGGADFCALVASSSDDVMGRDRCGAYGAVRADVLRPEIRDAIRGRAAGEIVGPLKVGDAVVLVQIVSPPRPPTNEELGAELDTKIQARILRERFDHWLADLRRAQP
jgi:PPIC-type peptidyl-prolyl cis-trans isomerase-like protein